MGCFPDAKRCVIFIHTSTSKGEIYDFFVKSYRKSGLRCFGDGHPNHEKTLRLLCFLTTHGAYLRQFDVSSRWIRDSCLESAELVALGVFGALCCGAWCVGATLCRKARGSGGVPVLKILVRVLIGVWCDVTGGMWPLVARIVGNLGS